LPWFALLPVVVLVFYLTFFFPFLQWDAIASWNRWAVVFAQEVDSLRRVSWFYPQFLSFSYSFIYKAAGDSSATPLAHGMAFIHMMLFVGALVGLSKRIGLKTPVAMALPFVCVPFAQHVASGYADIPAAAFAAISAGVLLQSEAEQRLRLFVLRCCFAGWLAAVGLLHKQLGVVPFFVLPLVWVLTAPGSARKRHVLGAVIFFVVGGLSLLPWTLGPSNWFDTRYIGYLTHSIYGEMSWGQRVMHAFVSVVQEFTVVASPILNICLALLALACVSVAVSLRTQLRPIVLVALGVFLCWMMFFSYDNRNLMAMIPFFCISVVAGGELILGRIFRISVRSWWVVGLFMTTAIAGVGAAYQLQWPASFIWHYSAISSAFTANPLDGSHEKLARYIRGYHDLLTWERVCPLQAPFQYWLGDPRLCALAQKGIPKRLDGFIDNLSWVTRDNQGDFSWRKGDVVLVDTNDIAHAKFVKNHVALGKLKLIDQIGCLTGYEVVVGGVP
jgi:hypothetical protein